MADPSEPAPTTQISTPEPYPSGRRPPARRELLWSHPGMSTYCRSSHGRVVSVWPFSVLEYRQMTHDVELSDFVVTRG
jgi:hypothetical protein